jgi:tRNA1(Val) A37 N6-methylase TrmN6
MLKEMNLSDQALGAVMMALQKSLLEQSDIVPVLKGFKFKLSEEGLVVMNPPLVKFNEDTQEKLRESAGLDDEVTTASGS